MKKHLLFVLVIKTTLLFLFLLSKTVYTQNVNLEVFQNYIEIHNAPSINAAQFALDSLETYSYYTPIRIRGYLLPPESGYYKFYILTYNYMGSFYLSSDSMEYHKQLAVTNSGQPYVWSYNWMPDWPANPEGRYNSYVTYYMDSVYLNAGKPYYFEAYSVFGIGLKWVLPGGTQLQTISGSNIKPARPKPVWGAIDWEIFENQSSYDFDALKNTELIPNRTISLTDLQPTDLSTPIDNFCSRMRGYIIPPETGMYSFYFAADDAGQFWLSPDTSQANAELKSNITSAHSDWTQNVSTQSLIANQHYFFEILQHDSTGPDLIKLGWAIQGDTTIEKIELYNLIGYLDSVSPNNIKFADNVLYAQKNKNITPQYQVFPWNTSNKNVRWVSTNTPVATVTSNGEINSHTNGESQIIIYSDADSTLTDTLLLNCNEVKWELFENRMSYDFNSLKNAEEIPDKVVDLNSLQTQDYSTRKDHFSSRIRGYLLPPVSGAYNFYLAADNVAQFWLSSDESMENAQLKSNISSIHTNWTDNISLQHLSAGNKYFFEILHYDSTYTDLIKLGWKIPGDTSIKVISTPYMVSSGGNIPVTSFSILDEPITAFPGQTIQTHFSLKPWNANNQQVHWVSNNPSIATTDANGSIHTISSGFCQIIGISDANASLNDTLNLTVSYYYGPFFVKPDAATNKDGHSWENAVDLQKLLEILNRGRLDQQVTIYLSEGTYKPTTTIDQNKSFLILNNIRLAGGYPVTNSITDTTNRDVASHETILSGEIGNQDETIDNSYHVVKPTIDMPGWTPQTIYVIIDGIKIRDGRATASAYGSTPGFYQFKSEDNGGGILNWATDLTLKNCTIMNNSAYNSGAGIYNVAGKLNMVNCLIDTNQIKQEAINTGGMFQVFANANGGGITLGGGVINAEYCIFTRNTSGYGHAIYMDMGTANLKCCSIYNNHGPFEDLWANNFTTLILDNSTLIGHLAVFANSTVCITNSTIVGGGFSSGGFIGTGSNGNVITMDNSIWTNINLSQLPDTNLVRVKYSVLNNQLFGVNKYDIISDSVPIYTSWLDTVANNGGLTPTMKLKNVPNNPAKSNGNLQYLGTVDQRGALRIDSVSIGAYQYDYPNSGIIQVKVFPEGLINTSNGSLNKSHNGTGEQYLGAIADKITIELHQVNAPFNIIGTPFFANLLTTGFAQSMSTTTLPDSVYVVIKHRNSIETWSSTPVSPVNAMLQYDFTKQINSAFGNNLKSLGSYFGLYCGDVNQDGVLDILDMNQIENQANNFGIGYIPEDLNGDGAIDALDMILLDNNSFRFVEAEKP